MKAVLTLLLILFFGAIALAQNTESHDNIQTIKMGVVLDTSPDVLIDFKESKKVNDNEVARLYKFKDSRIKTALSFATKKNQAKIT